MSELAFLRPGRAVRVDGVAPRYRSPLERALGETVDALRDLSSLGKLEVRGDVGSIDVGEAVPITARRALVLCDAGELDAVHAALRGRFRLVVDVSAAYAGLAVRGERLLRRLTDLDLDRLPAVGRVADVRAVLVREHDEFRIFFGREYADFVAEVVLDAARGLR